MPTTPSARVNTKFSIDGLYTIPYAYVLYHFCVEPHYGQRCYGQNGHGCYWCAREVLHRYWAACAPRLSLPGSRNRPKPRWAGPTAAAILRWNRPLAVGTAVEPLHRAGQRRLSALELLTRSLNCVGAAPSQCVRRAPLRGGDSSAVPTARGRLTRNRAVADCALERLPRSRPTALARLPGEIQYAGVGAP